MVLWIVNNLHLRYVLNTLFFLKFIIYEHNFVDISEFLGSLVRLFGNILLDECFL